jgi:hypothetical protein
MEGGRWCGAGRDEWEEADSCLIDAGLRLVCFLRNARFLGGLCVWRTGWELIDLVLNVHLIVPCWSWGFERAAVNEGIHCTFRVRQEWSGMKCRASHRVQERI